MSHNHDTLNNHQEENIHECTDGACAIDFTQEAPTKTDIFNKEYIVPSIALVFLLIGIALQHFEVPFFSKPIALIWFGVIYIFIGGPIVLKSLKKIAEGDVYNEFVLMSVATIGAFAIGSYAEGISVMLFYVIGELFQESAVNKAKRSIEALLKVQVDEVQVEHEGKVVIKHPKDVKINDIIHVKAGQKVALDGILISEKATLNTAALTGESVPNTTQKGENVFAGMINLNTPIKIQVTHAFEDTKLSKILTLVQEAVGKKAKTQLLISRLAKVYTPIVFWLAVALVIIPYFVLGADYVFQTWFQRALIFLVISCPCALVISIPLGYFGGIGAASKNGILFKGSNYLDIITTVDTIVLDKTGTLTEGVFQVQEIQTNTIPKEELLSIVAALEKHSTHPIATAIVEASKTLKTELKAIHIEEFSGKGMKGEVEGKQVLVGNSKLLDTFKIEYPKIVTNSAETIAVVAIDNEYAGHILIADKIKEDAKIAIKNISKILSITDVILLSGDQQAVVNKVATQLGIKTALGNLLPEDKFNEVEKLKKQGKIIAFIGDGINDAPVIAASHVGIAMGGLGSDAAIETADVIIQTDQPSKIATAIKIGNATKKIIWQNIFLALGVKILVLILGAMGMATMWEAVIADVGVALLAILNAVRIQRMKFNN